MQIALPNNWAPRAYQQNAWNYLHGGGKRAALCWARRHGKDDLSMHWTAMAAHEVVGSYWHMLPEQAQGQKAIWRQVNKHTGKKRIDEAFPKELRARTLDDEMFIEFKNGSTWQVVGSDNYDSLVGASVAGLVFSEYARSDPSAWAYLRPILRENKGWAIFISTAFGKNHFYHMMQMAKQEPDWFSEVITYDDSQLITKEELASELRELQAEHGESYGKSIWLQEYFCSFDAAIPGAIWAESLDRLQLNGRIVDFDHSPSSPVFTGWDLGRTDDTAIWFYQFRGAEIDVIDYWADHGCEIYDSDAKEKSISHILLDKSLKYGYKYGTHWVPHDARPRRLGMGGKSILQQFHDAATRHPALGKFAVAPRLDVQEGIQAARKTFQDCRFHATKCDLGLQALRHYHREWDPDKKLYTDVPVHDWSSHCFTGETEVLTRYGMRSISNLPKTGEVLTLCGWMRYENPRITRRNAQLVEVGFSDGLSVRCTPDHLFLTENGWISAKSLTSTMQIRSSLTPSRSISMAVSTVYGQAIDTCREVVRNFTEMCGRWPLVQSLKAVISTIKTAIQKTISSPILNVSPQACISQQRLGSSTQLEQSTLRMKQELGLLTGIGLKRDDSGIDGIWPRRNLGPNGNMSQCSVQGAIKSFKAFLGRMATRKNSAQKNAKCLSIESVELVSQPADVWCLTVPGVEHFSLSNGAIVHNCADAWRTVALTWKASKIQTPEEQNKPIETRGWTWGQATKHHFERRRALREGAF